MTAVHDAVVSGRSISRKYVAGKTLFVARRSESERPPAQLIADE